MKILSVALVLVLALTAAACGGDDDDNGGSISVADATNCEQVVDAFMPILQDLLNSMSDLTMADLMSDTPPEPLADFEQRLDEVGNKSDELNCSDAEMASLLNNRVDDLTAEGPVAEFLLELLKSEGFE